MRKVLVYSSLLLVASCDSGFDPLPPVDPQVQFTVDLQAPERAVPGPITVTGTCELFVGGFQNVPEQLVLTVDGVESARSAGADIEAEVEVGTVGPHTVAIQCLYEDEGETSERTVEVVEPVWVTVHLRNFTQTGEPFVRNEGPITFTVGEKHFMSPDSVVVPVLPGAEHQIFAEHADFVPMWARIADHDSGELLEFYHVRDKLSPVFVAERRSVDVFKIRESDVTSIRNTYHEWERDTSPYYTLDDLRRTLYGEYTPYTGGLNRLDGEKVTIWLNGISLDRAAGVRAAIQKLFVVVGPNHMSNLTDGLVQSGEIVDDDATPVDRPLIELAFQEYPWHWEYMTPEGAISHSTVYLPASSNLSTAYATFLQAIGLRGTIGYNAVDDYVVGDGIPSPYARLALKILYASPTNARF